MNVTLEAVLEGDSSRNLSLSYRLSDDSIHRAELPLIVSNPYDDGDEEEQREKETFRRSFSLR